ncbi:asparagine synthetase B, partial [Vibrio cholerae]
MCGIFGFVDYTKKISKEKLIIITDTLYRRGPDNGGYSLIEAENYNIGFGHRRLSIVDLSDNGNQPFRYDDLVLVFNGEIYNYKNLKKKLIDVGYEFSSTSDTEVVIKCIHYYGIDKAIAKF